MNKLDAIIKEKDKETDYNSFKLIEYNTYKLSKELGWDICSCWTKHVLFYDKYGRRNICCSTSFDNDNYEIISEIDEGLIIIELYHKSNPQRYHKDNLVEIYENTDPKFVNCKLIEWLIKYK